MQAVSLVLDVRLDAVTASGMELFGKSSDGTEVIGLRRFTAGAEPCEVEVQTLSDILRLESGRVVPFEATLKGITPYRAFAPSRWFAGLCAIRLVTRNCACRGRTSHDRSRKTDLL